VKRPASILGCILVASVAALATGCDEPGGSFNKCASAYAGTFEGDRQGTVLAYMDPDAGEMTFQFFEDGDDDEWDFNILASITRAGSISSSGNVNVQGMLDIDDCTASGEWNVFAMTGSFEMAIRSQ
jgi:hypothetical protein